MPGTFETSELLELVEVLRPPRAAFLDFFFKMVKTFDTKQVEIDIYKEKQVLAGFTHPYSEGRMNVRTEFERLPFTPPYVKEKLSCHAGDLLNIRRGDVVYNSKETPRERAANQVAEDMREIQNMITRREEWIASKLLDGGQVNIVGKGLNYTIDFDMPAGNQVVLGIGDRWGDAGVDILKDLREFKRILSQASGKTPNVAFFGADVIDVFLADPQVQAILDNRRFEVGSIEMRKEMEEIDGITYVGHVEGLHIFGYDEQYLETVDGAPQDYMPRNKIFMGSTRAKTSRNYGLIQDKKALYATRWFFKMWEIEDPSVELLMGQSAPLPALSESCAFGVFEVLA